MNKMRDKTALSGNPDLKKPLRLLPGVIIVALQWLLRYLLPLIIPGTAEIGVLVGLAGGLAIIIWWAFFSRAHRIERWGAVVLMIVALVAGRGLVHESISTGFRGMMYFVFAVPVIRREKQVEVFLGDIDDLDRNTEVPFEAHRLLLEHFGT